MDAIVIGTHKNSLPMLENLCQSLAGYTRPIYLAVCQTDDPGPAFDIARKALGSNNNLLATSDRYSNYELGAISMAHTVWPEISSFVFLEDSIEVKNPYIFDLLFTHDDYRSKSVMVSPGYFHFLGKYQRHFLQTMKFPLTLTKRQAVEAETFWNREYISKSKAIQFQPEVPLGSDKYEEKFGRQNMVVENEYLIKRKACWATHQITD